jgi:hypothetical protein
VKTRVCHCIVILAAAACAIVAQVNEGTIQGVISDEGGHALAGAFVIATPLGPAGGVTYTAVSNANGQFNLSHARPAAYMVCVQMPRSAFLDPCSWSSPMHVTVAAGQVSPNNNVQMTKGSLLHVRVNDPDQHVSKGDGDVLLGIGGPSFPFHPLGLAATDPAGRTFDMAIPFNLALRLQISSEHLDLADEQGAALGSTPAAVLIQQSPGQGDPTLTFNIKGKK